MKFKQSNTKWNNLDWNSKYIGENIENWDMWNRQNGLSNGRTANR